MTFTSFYILLICSFLYLVGPTLSLAKTNEQFRTLKHVELQEELNREYRNANCYKKKQKCSNDLPNLPNLETRAVLVRCPNPKPCAQDSTLRRVKEPICNVTHHDVRQYHGFDEDEPVSPLSLTKCRKKLLLTIRISKHQFDPSKNQYVIVDHVYDPITGKYSRLLAPYVIKFMQEPTMQLYELKFLHVVNSKVREKIINKRTVQNYTGCDISSSHPTCGRITYKNKVIPFSQGFCCSCDQYTNYIRQPPCAQQYSADVMNFGDPAYLLGGIECPKYVKGSDTINEAADLLQSSKKDSSDRPDTEQMVVDADRPWESPLKKMKYHPMIVKHPNSEKNYTVTVYSGGNGKKGDFCESQTLRGSGGVQSDVSSDDITDIDKTKDEGNDEDSQNLIEKIENLSSLLRIRKSVSKRLYRRQVQVGGTQRRGGQNCADRYTPKSANKVTYHESSHCLRFSDLWYTVYRLKTPIIEHAIRFQIFQKQMQPQGVIFWRDITAGKQARVSTLLPMYVGENKTYSIEFKPQINSVDTTTFALNHKAALLMVPEDVTEETTKKYPETRGGAKEFLVVHASQVTLDGDLCNVAGVGFEAFYKQSNRCAKPPGTCLKNQPYDLWLHDHQAMRQNLKGCFFLKNFGEVPEEPIRKINGRTEKYLFIEYDKKHTSKIDIEIQADFNTVLRKQSSVKITEVYVDNSVRGKLIVTAKLTNSGLISAKFMTKITDCPLDIPALFNNIQSKQVLIPPQHQHVFTMVINCDQLPVEMFHCSVEALNFKHELVVLRRIRIQKYDKCVCAWHCLCACAGSSEGVGCTHMSLQHYHAAGFEGSLPITSYTIRYSFFDDPFSLIMYIFFSLLLILILLGLCKALLGIFCCLMIGIIGLGVILDLPRNLNKYHEPELKNKKVIYDRQGWPVHPKTGKRVRSISVATEFCINVTFFFAYPACIALLLIRRVWGKGDGKQEPLDNIPCMANHESHQGKYRFTSSSNTSARRRGFSKTTEMLSSEAEVRLSTIISIQEDDSSLNSETETNEGDSENANSELIGVGSEKEVKATSVVSFKGTTSVTEDLDEPDQDDNQELTDGDDDD